MTQAEPEEDDNACVWYVVFYCKCCVNRLVRKCRV